MFFQLGALFLLGTLSVSSGQPPCVCTRILKPVCGSDGETYGNECMLQCAQLTNPQLFTERSGRCDGSTLGPPRVVRQVDCICTLEYRPFCGTDGKTYPNRCSLNCAKRSAPVDVAYPGTCRKKRETLKAADLSFECSCSRNFAPVCGSDGNTYDNDCVLTCFSQSKPELRLKHVGLCESEVQSCSCSREAIPVCGTDGNTYENACFLKCAKDNNKDLEMLYAGKCDKNAKVIDFHCLGCTRELRPMCGTDGNTYRSPCMLNCAREQDVNLHIDYPGPCDSRLTIVDPQACPSCTPKVKPVCGTDGNSYRNTCMLRCARDYDANLHIEYEGFCIEVADVEENSE